MSNVQILLPTRNLPHYLARCLEFLHRRNNRIPIVIADSSNPFMLRKNVDVVEHFHRRGMAITLMTFDTSLPFFDKVAAALGQMEVDLVAIVADDDFIVPATVEKCASFLAENSEYSIALGKMSTVSVDLRFPIGSRRRVNSVTYDQFTVDSIHATERLRMHMRRYAPIFYSVGRRVQLYDVYQATQQYTSDYQFGEILPSCLSMVQGKRRCFGDLFLMRQGRAGSEASTCPPWSKFMLWPDFSERYQRYKECLVAALVRRTGHTPEAMGDVVDETFVNYLAVSGLGDIPRRLNLENDVEKGRGWRGYLATIEHALSLRDLKRDPLDIRAVLTVGHPYEPAYRDAFDLLSRYPEGIPTDMAVS